MVVLAYQALRKDRQLRGWYKRILRRRERTIAKVVVMRKPSMVVRQMLQREQTYFECRGMAGGLGARV